MKQDFIPVPRNREERDKEQKIACKKLKNIVKRTKRSMKKSKLKKE